MLIFLVNIYQFLHLKDFPHEEDVSYLAHCYPYTFTDLKEDLDSLINAPDRKECMKREVLCETRAGNSCFLVTVSNFGKLAYNIDCARP